MVIEYDRTVKLSFRMNVKKLSCYDITCRMYDHVVAALLHQVLGEYYTVGCRIIERFTSVVCSATPFLFSRPL
jgi:hypothetical protein